MKQRIIVLGSSNTDFVIKADHLPKKGETITGGKFFMNPGGKGANQAVAASRLGGRVTLISKIGTDLFGKALLQVFEEEGINTAFVFTDTEHATGIALITVDKNGDNCIVVSSGANAILLPADLQDAAEAINEFSLVLMQLETPLETVEYMAAIAFKKGARIILNPAPSKYLTDSLLSTLFILTPNKKEAEYLSGIAITSIESAAAAARKLALRGAHTVMITLGGDGVLVLFEDEITHIPAIKVEAIDTTAAGDVFNGALAVCLSEGKTVLEAARYACKAAAVSVTRIGAQSSAPFTIDLQQLNIIAD